MSDVGDKIGGFEVVARLELASAPAILLGRRSGPRGAEPVALKVRRNGAPGGRGATDAWIARARAWTRVRHPNVVRVVAVGTEGEGCFVATEFVYGCSLARLMRVLIEQGRALDPRLAVGIVLRLADALAAASEVLPREWASHGALVTRNVLLAYDGAVKLRGAVAVTGRENAPDGARSDVRALAVLLWQLLTSQRPVGPEGGALLAPPAGTRALPGPPSAFAPGIGPALDRVVADACSLHARGPRVLDARGFARQLTAALPAAAAPIATELSGLLLATLGSTIAAQRRAMPPDVATLLAVGADAPRDLRLTPNVALKAHREVPARIRPRRRTRAYWGWIALVVVVAGALAAGLGFARWRANASSTRPTPSRASAH